VPSDRQRHWDTVYEGRDDESLSWFQNEPTVSLELIDVLGVAMDAGVIDVGGGTSRLVDRLLSRGFSDVSVLDVAASALAASQARIGADHRVTWITADLLSWQPERRYDLWHDRAVFHFFSDNDVATYRKLLLRATTVDGAVILSTFAPEGPEFCSGLRVCRYSADELGLVLGERFEVIDRRSQTHRTPSGVVQPFTWIAARRRS